MDVSVTRPEQRCHVPSRVHQSVHCVHAAVSQATRAALLFIYCTLGCCLHAEERVSSSVNMEHYSPCHRSCLHWWLHAYVWLVLFLQKELFSFLRILNFGITEGALPLKWHWHGTSVPHMSSTGRTNVTLPLFFLNWLPCHKHKSVAMVPSKEESLTRVPYIFKPLIGIASKVAPPAALPFSCCTATLVSGPGSLEEAAAAGRLRLQSLIGARGRLPLLLQLCCRWLTVGSKPCD